MTVPHTPLLPTQRPTIDGGRLARAWKGTATFTGRLEPAGVEPTGGRIEVTGVDVYDFAEGLVRRVVTETDTMSLLIQIGAAAAPPGSGQLKLPEMEVARRGKPNLL